MKVAIVGDAETTRALAPFDDPTWQIWMFGTGWVHMKRADVYFEPHTWEHVQRDNLPLERMFAVKELGVKRVSLHPTIPTVRFELPAEAFPHDELLEFAPRKWFTSSIAWLIAYALARHGHELTHLGIWGADMAGDDLYGAQLACTAWWLGLTEGRGINVVIPEGAMLLKGPLLYTLEDRENEARKAFFGVRRTTLVKEVNMRNSVLTAAMREKEPQKWQEFVESISRLAELDEIERLMTNAGQTIGEGTTPRDAKWDSGRGNMAATAKAIERDAERVGENGTGGGGA